MLFYTIKSLETGHIDDIRYKKIKYKKGERK